MRELSDIKNIRNLLAKHKFNFSHSLGQNFITNPEICPQMADLCAATSNIGVIEIGPGIGVLTCELARVAKKVVSIELDSKLMPVLHETLADYPNVKVINGDFLAMNLQSLVKEEFPGMNVVVCANLPYYITSPVIAKLIETRDIIFAATLMVQKEVADRICAGAGSKSTGAFSIFVNYFSCPELLFTVKRDNFVPAPKVDSAVIKLTMREEPKISVTDEKTFFRVVKSAFSLRRKTVLNSICAGLNISKNDLEPILINAGISGNLRAENLTMEQFGAVADAVFEKGF